MLFIKLETAGQEYALAVRSIVEIVPYVALRPYADAPAYVAGMLNFRGRVVPVIDLVRLLAGRAAAQRLSTRIILIDYPAADHRTYLVGILAEAITSTHSYENPAFVDPGYAPPDKPFLGKVVCDTEGIIQRIEPTNLLPPDLEAQLLTRRDTRP
ncbi:MAG: chemotaxis protein CheW [Spartobacteria bacterium]|nr:chemotaxis protein CheW [Spartobacteria bacterium]